MKQKVILRFTILAAITALALSGCAKNVDRIDFVKWGNSYIPQKASSIDTTAQGGATQNNQIPQNGKNAIPKASVGGAYQKTFATSPNYRLVGGFHVTPSQ